MENVWVANIVTGGSILAVMIWFFNRFVKSYDDRLERAEKESQEIKKNYIRRFEEIHEKVDDTKDELKDHFTREIQGVKDEKNNYRIIQSKEMGVIQTKLDHLTDMVKNRQP